MLVSVVVPTYRRPDLLERCLAALATQEFDPSAFEVIVADDAANESTRRQVEGWAGRSPILIRYTALTTAHGPAAARNAGWREARGEIIAFTDDDCIPAPRWLAEGVAAFAGGTAAVVGRVVVPIPERPTDYERDTAGLERAEFVTANCFVRRDVLADIGGFDVRYATAWREDSDLHFSLLKRGDPIRRAPGAIVVHPARPARWGISLWQQRKSLYNALLFKKSPRLYRVRIQSSPPWNYYAIAMSIAVMFFAAIRGRPGLAMVAAGIWAVLTAEFCARRLNRNSLAPRHVAEMVVTSALIPPLSVFWRIYGALKFRVFFL